MDQGYNLQRQAWNQFMQFIKSEHIIEIDEQIKFEKDQKQMKRILNKLLDKNILLEERALI